MIMPTPGRDPEREPEPDERRGCARFLGWSGVFLAAVLLAVAAVTGHFPA